MQASEQPKQAQPETNPTRTAPLCTACAHYRVSEPEHPRDVRRRDGLCNHPGTPVNPETGAPTASVQLMRQRYQDSRLGDEKSAHCGLEAKLFMPRPSGSPEISLQQAGGQLTEFGAYVAQAVTDLIAQRQGKHVGTAGAEQPAN